MSVIIFPKQIKASTKVTIQETQIHSTTYNPQTGEDLIVTVYIPSRFPDMTLVKPYIIGTYKGNYSSSPSHQLNFSPSEIKMDIVAQTLTLTYKNADFSPFDSTWMNDGISTDIEFTDGNTSWGVHNYEEFAQYTIEFFDNYPGNNNSTIMYVPKAGANLIQPPVPATRDGYTFSGWYLEPEAITKYVFLPAPLTQNIQLYAGWTANPVIPSDPATNMPTVDPVIPSNPATNMPTVDPVIPSNPATNMPTVDPVIPSDPATNMPTVDSVIPSNPVTNTAKSTPIISTLSKLQKQDSFNSAESTKLLPKTGENNTEIILEIGTILIILGSISLYYKKHFNV
ncbi:InlB B-repeat-containing protein [Lactococcus sp. LG1267]|uniref:InlB B-repeat-containing protein n=1 Tax=Lactococcus sp. LG1267 TaxID=2816910 RepID=UPI001A9019DA|nr:InlB B-repeat-containing protein [Lactococcus sp. LG1267]QSR03610.1 InlB B-repeat-containing protein [Lactococcus sp. LG1267]